MSRVRGARRLNIAGGTAYDAEASTSTSAMLVSEPETDASRYFVGTGCFPPFPDLGGHIIGAEASAFRDVEDVIVNWTSGLSFGR